MKKFLLLLSLFLFAGCSFFSEESSKILILYTNDEHGHFYEKDGWYKGAALYEMWEEEEKNCKNCEVIRLSGGDNYTGTAVSTFSKGGSMAEIMNVLGYKAIAVGNHEFDFGEKSFEENARLAGAPYICANIVSKEGKNIFEPYKVFYAGKTKILLVSVITETVRDVSMSEIFHKSDILKPEKLVEKAIADEKADLNLVLAHESYIEILPWVLKLPEKPLAVFTGHDHKESVVAENGVQFIQNAGYLQSYAKVVIEKKGKNFKILEAETVPLKRDLQLKSQNAVKIKEMTDSYMDSLNKIAGVELIQAVSPVPQFDFQKFYACSLLEYFPDSDAAVSNPGGFRDLIKAGTVRKSDILSMFPFENFIVRTGVSGEDLIYDISLSENAYCGVLQKDGKWLLENGAEIEKSGTYQVITTDFLYKGGNGYRFSKSHGNQTDIIWREPVENFMLESSKRGLKFEDAFRNLMKKHKIEENQ